MNTMWTNTNRTVIRHLLALAGVLPLWACAQCRSGNCKDGEGKMDLGYAVYTGSFRNGQPHGTGTLDCGGGDKYAGSFINGKEDGAGLLFKKGVASPVTYRMGQLVTKKEPVVIGGNSDWKQGIPGCISGDCANGRGTMKFPSGNVYEGEFRNYQFNGKGTMSFASGNRLEGQFVDHLPQEGSFFYAAEGVLFKGRFNPDGTPAMGTYTSPASGGVVDIKEGTITAARNPRLDSMRAAQPKLVLNKCDRCGGKGYAKTTRTSYSNIGGIGTIGATGYVTWDYEPRSIEHKSTSYDLCTQCKGSGQVERYERQKN